MNQIESKSLIAASIEETIQSKARLLEQVELIEKIANRWIDAIQKGGTIILFGNGGSAADAQHIAAELIGRFVQNRKSLPAIALTVNTSNILAIANDYGFEHIFSRQLEGLLKKEDVVVALSTSGNSPNVLNGITVAKEKGCFTIGFTGESGGKLKSMVDLCLMAPASKSSRIQEAHIMVGHIVCEIVERVFSDIPSLAC